MIAPVVGLSGYARSGKDAVAGVLIAAGGTLTSIGPLVAQMAGELGMSAVVSIKGKELSNREWSKIRAVIDIEPTECSVPIDILVETLGYERAKEIEDVRVQLQRLGSGIKDKPGGGRFWIDWALSEVKDRAVVSGVRSMPEVQAIRDRHGIVVWVNRPGYGPANDHINERQLSADDCDMVLENDGTLEQLHGLVRSRLLG